MRVVILGAGGQARECIYYLKAMTQVDPSIKFVGCVVSDLSQITHNDSKEYIVGDETWLDANTDCFDALVIGIGSHTLRRKLGVSLRQRFPNCSWPQLVHPSASFDINTCHLGEGIIIGVGVVATVNLRVDDFAMVNFGVTLGHDVEIGFGSVINPGANVSGRVTIGKEVLVGAGAVILQNLTVGDGATIGAGAVVTKSVSPQATVIGIPARPQPVTIKTF